MEDIQTGRYRVLSVLGQGGMATVYRALDTRLQVHRAIKVLDPAVAQSAQVRARFESEARTMARLQHPNLVTVMDVGEDADRTYIVMELLDGGSLHDRIEREGPLSPRQASTVIQHVLGALRLAHSRGVIHRDVKPHNVLVDEDGVPKLTDFGIARVKTEDTRTRTGAAMGTLAYMAPEQCINAKEVDERADIYGVGVTLYALLKGGEPADSLYVSEIYASAMAGLPEPLVEVITKATRYRAADRYPSAEAMRDALAAVHDRLPSESGAAPLLGPGPDPDVTLADQGEVLTGPVRLAAGLQRLRGRVLLVGGLACGLALVGWGVTDRGPDPSSPEPTAPAGVPAPEPPSEEAAVEIAEEEPVEVPVETVPKPPPEPEPEPAPPARRSKPQPKAEPEPVPPATGRMLINTLPWSHVQVDGVDHGTTDFAGTFEVGPHNLVLRTADDRVKRLVIEVPEDDTAVLCWDFARGSTCSR